MCDSYNNPALWFIQKLPGDGMTKIILCIILIYIYIYSSISLKLLYMVTPIAGEHSWMGVCSDLVQTAISVQTKVAIETVSPFRLASHVLIESCDI